MSPLRAIAKAAFERLAIGSGVPGLMGRTKDSLGLILAYHNILPEGEEACGDRSLHLPQAIFARQLDLLQQYARVVPLQELMTRPVSAGRPRVAVTFDDAYHGAITAGIAELRNRSLPATVFVAPAFLGGNPFWWDSVATPGGLTASHREAALASCQGRDALVRAWASDTGLTLQDLPAHARAATERELEIALEYPSLSLGSHTWGHPNLTRVPDDELGAELVRPREWLQQRFGARVQPILAYPYGLSDARVRDATRRAGYDAAFAVLGGWLPPTLGDRFALPRLNVPAGISADAFRLRLAGFFC